MTVAASKLDTEKFRKVHVMMTGGATPGERSAAKARAEAMAAKAGMTLKAAVSSLGGRQRQKPAAAPKPRNFFQDMEDAMEAKHPGWKAERSAAEAERERKRAELRAEAIADYGSVEGVFAQTKRERLLREALEPLADWKTYGNGDDRYIDGYAGWTCRNPTPPVWEFLASAYPFPNDLAGVWQERNEWERRQDMQCAFEPNVDMLIWVRARLAALEHLLDTLPDPTPSGVRTRLEWLEALNDRGYSRDQEEDARLIAVLRADFEALQNLSVPASSSSNAAPSEGYPQSGHPLPHTTAEKRAAILSMLDSEPGLSDREIARRLGVSPQTVNTWRKKR